MANGYEQTPTGDLHQYLDTRIELARRDLITIQGNLLVPSDVKGAVNNTVQILEILIELEKRHG